MPTPQIIEQHATWAVVATWLIVAAILAGSGHLARRSLLCLMPASHPLGLSRADLWIGLAALVAYLQLWSLVFRIGPWTWLAPAVAGVAGLALGIKPLRSASLRPSAIGAVAAVGAAALWLANQSFGVPGLYDLGLYHLNIIEYAERYPAIPGLANLSIRLGASDPHLLLAAFLDQGPWAGAGFQLVSGLLEVMLLADVASRFAFRHRGPDLTFSNRLGVLVAAGSALAIATSPQHWLAAPNLDTGALITVCVGMLYLAETVERGFDAGIAIAAAAVLALNAATRPLYWPCAIYAIVLVVVLARRRGSAGYFRAAAVAGSLPAAIAAGWMARQAILSGYLFFPLALGGLPVDWRVPQSIIHAQNRGDASFARVQQGGVDSVVILNSWHWLTAAWLPARKHDLNVVLPLTLLACIVPFLAHLAPDASRHKRTDPLLAVLAPVLVTLGAWFLLIPDPRFALALFWLVPCALAAWALPPIWTHGSHYPRVLSMVMLAIAGTAGGVTLAWIWQTSPTWLIPSALAGWALVFATALATRRPFAHQLGYAAAVSALVAGLWIVARLNAFEPMPSSFAGPFGAPTEPVPKVAAVVTSSGLRLVVPVDTDQCWAVLLCSPQVSPALHLRGDSVRDGFSLR